MPKKVLLFILPLFFILLYPHPVSAAAPSPYCCDSPLTYSGGFCFNAPVINFCDGVTNLLCSQTLIGSLLCTLTSASDIARLPCLGLIGEVGLAGGTITTEDFCTALLDPHVPPSSILRTPAIAACTVLVGALPEIIVRPPKVNTALGCLSVEFVTTIQTIFDWAIGITGGLIFFVILIATLRIITSRGDPKAVKAGQELLTSALLGFVLIAFAVILLNIIGIKVLNLGNLGFSP